MTNNISSGKQSKGDSYAVKGLIFAIMATLVAFAAIVIEEKLFLLPLTLFAILFGILATYFSIYALRNAGRKKTIGLIALIIGVSAGIALPPSYYGYSYFKAIKMLRQANARLYVSTIGVALCFYRGDHQNKYPDSLKTLVDTGYLDFNKGLLAMISQKNRIPGLDELDNYVFLRPKGEAGNEQILVYLKPELLNNSGTAVLKGSYNTVWVDIDEFNRLKAKSP